MIQKFPILWRQISLRSGDDGAFPLPGSGCATCFKVLQSWAGVGAVAPEVRHFSSVLAGMQACPVTDQSWI